MSRRRRETEIRLATSKNFCDAALEILMFHWWRLIRKESRVRVFMEMMQEYLETGAIKDVRKRKNRPK